MASLTIQESFDLAVRHHQAGRLPEAERIYRQILAQQPSHAGAMHFLGVIAHQGGQHDLAVDLIRRAIALNFNSPEAYGNLGNALRARRDLDEAILAYQQAIALRPGFAEAYYRLGIALKDKGQLDEAIAAFQQAIVLRPNYPEAHGNLGKTLKAKEQLDEAIAAFRQAAALGPNLPEAHYHLGIGLKDKGLCDEAIAEFRQAIALKPNFPEAYGYLGNALKEKGQVNEAIAAYREAIAQRPNLLEAHFNLGIALRETGQFDEAIAACRQAIAIKPDYLEAHSNLGNALTDKGRFDEAIAVHRQAIAISPDMPGLHNNLGIALRCKGELDEAIAAYRRAIVLRPNFPQAHYNLSLGLLARGDYQEGWEEYEWRWKWKELPPPRNFAQPQWDGELLEGRTLLLHAEQGFGDAIQFIRYLPMVAERGGKIIVECQPDLRRLFGTIAHEQEIVARGRPLPKFDLHCPLLGLPRIFVTTMETIPSVVPYLNTDAALVEKWREKLGPGDGRLRIGLAWAGSPRFKMDGPRSLNLQQLALFADVADVKFYSLQKGLPAEQAKHPPTGLELVDLGPELKDFADTAAVMSLMDLIVTTDTSVPHLAGALGRPVWVMLQFVPDFRWLLNRPDSPWYPSMRLFRQPHPGDWDSVIADVVDALSSRKNSQIK